MHVKKAEAKIKGLLWEKYNLILEPLISLYIVHHFLINTKHQAE